MLIYFSPRVISSICKYWFRIRQPRALLGVECFQGCQSIEKIQGLVLQWELCLAEAESGLVPLCRDQAGLGWAESKGWVSAERLVGCFALEWVALKGERTIRAKWSNAGRKDHQAMNTKTIFLPSLLPQTEGPIPHYVICTRGASSPKQGHTWAGPELSHISWTHLTTGGHSREVVLEGKKRIRAITGG